ncbi:protein of unknown function [Flavobacterium fluvii]|uniref:DUF4136 domain-containing protein n=1 Tax=Flavobacterium fluvii TaxID=468056 RepID=A0A1M5IDL2_9FLAO|nr:DUF4136 domain-containing protein [Flavobacterium fluvii]SHG25873.1 protein of unknown function [Flavobacterium fluvii]
MSATKFIPILLLFMLSSCGSSIKVNSDFDESADFSQYKTYSFNKSGIDRIQFSSLDKKKILESIETKLVKKGMTESEKPDLIVYVSTEEKKKVDKSPYYGGLLHGMDVGKESYPMDSGYYGYNPYWSYWGDSPYAPIEIEGTLFIYFLDTAKNELIWLGKGVGSIPHSRSKKVAFVNDLVETILMQFPPVLAK